MFLLDGCGDKTGNEADSQKETRQQNVAISGPFLRSAAFLFTLIKVEETAETFKNLQRLLP
jgi:hypothetical protein